MLAYQSGVVISRSSIRLVKLREVWAFCLMQAIGFTFWLTEVILLYRYNTKMLTNIYGMILTLFLIGIMGGGCYANTMYAIITHKDLAFYQKELALNICTFLDDCGIIGASVTALIFSNYVFPI